MVEKLILIIAFILIFSFILEKLNLLSNNKANSKITELKKVNKSQVSGIVFGKKGSKFICSPENSEGHVGVFSATGTGKTAAIGIPTLRAWNGSMFVIDISGDIEKNCPGVENKLIFDPDNLKEYKLKYDVFANCDNLVNDFEKDEYLAQLAYLLMPNPIKAGESSDFFIKNGRKILISSLIAYYHQGYDFIEICKKILESSYINLFTEIDGFGNELASSYIGGFVGANEKNTAGCKQAVDEALTLFATNHNVATALGRADLNNKAFKPGEIEDNNIFIIVDDPKLELYAPMLNLITSQIMEYISNRRVNDESKTILLFLDEYTSLKIDSETILQALRKYRKRKARIMLLTQNLADLNVLYTPDVTKSIMANFKYKVLLGGLNEPESQKYFAELIGFKDVLKKSTSKSSRQETLTKSESQEYYIKPADLDKQGKNKLILIHSEGNRYMILDKNFYFKN